MPVLSLNSVKDTTLWKRLNHAFSGDDHEIAQHLATNLKTVCAEASDRMKAMPTLMPQFTLHDSVHGLRVTELMSRIMPKSVVESLNPIEIALLILAAFFHDQGMVMEEGELNQLETDADFQLFRENWTIDHPNLKIVRERMRNKDLDLGGMTRLRSAEHEMHGAMLTDFIRRTHGERSAKFLRTVYTSDKRLTVAAVGLAEFVARLSVSHVAPAQSLNPANGFQYDEMIGIYSVNMVYLGLVLRLADIMDFDRDRTPDSLYRTIDFRGAVSLQEWDKHRSVEGWKIDWVRFFFSESIVSCFQ